ncbi:MAG: class I SAM-dependent methyltransferase [Candidatus Jordarchaeaceae archaeon]
MILFKLSKDLIKKIINTTLVIHIFRRELSKMTTIEDCVTLAYTFHDKIKVLPPRMRWHFAIFPAQMKEEIIQLLEKIVLLKPKALLEIGTANGGTLFLFCRVATPETLIVSMDLPGGRFGGGYPEWKIPLFRSFALTQKIFLLQVNSHDSTTLEKMKEILKEQKIDFLFIDGDHTYEGVRKDFQMYGSLVRKGGIIAFHDIVPGPPENVGGVPQFWHEIKNAKNYKCSEIVSDWDQEGCGIGVIYV